MQQVPGRFIRFRNEKIIINKVKTLFFGRNRGARQKSPAKTKAIQVRN